MRGVTRHRAFAAQPIDHFVFFLKDEEVVFELRDIGLNIRTE
jgi:hypothetical protein